MKSIFIILGLLICGTVNGKPADSRDAIVEIEKQRLVKFPEDIDQRHDDDTNSEKTDEAKRILEEIDKINKALGYVKKQPERKLPPILDSSQYLFPKPTYHPFHAQNHQVAGSNGETLLVPSIRAINFPQALINYNVPVKRKNTKEIQSLNVKNLPINPIDLNANKEQLELQKPLFFRPNQVIVPHSAAQKQQLPTEFVLPVHLYKLNKEEFIEKNSPQQYRIKSYNIVGDIDHFYGKTKTKQKVNKPGSNLNSSLKYHLFFLPQDITLDETAMAKHSQKQNSTIAAELSKEDATQDTGSREHKQAVRPYKVQTSLSTNTNKGGTVNATAITQITRKRVVPRPVVDREPSALQVATQQLQNPNNGNGNSNGAVITTAHITPPTAISVGNNQQNVNGKPNKTNVPQNSNYNKNPNNNNANIGTTNNSNTGTNNNNNGIIRPLSNQLRNSTASTIIKNAFQNIFKLPFRGEGKPNDPTPLGLQYPQSAYLAGQASIPQPNYSTGLVNDDDYKWDDSASNSAAEEESTEHVEKQFFGNRHEQQQNTQREALKQGGIIIQRLKVRKGGIAIAGPGGVATAGSGGTAIVGPGGYALTHPRSLIIAGPGAKVIAIPADVDLQDALQRTDLSTKSFPREGKIVATGPTVYYSPATGAAGEV
ncbi:rho GTPase-activating protein gacK-like [Teleopsis dalmanni]|uniref:rho GTPase-activating protein gacK-like n=1 Tax=Teleopsis dalmanni TaxID=139649 RepID=UPI0018CDCDD1|nr:rho GTPase-activating protein gacK-like [Teleopsis dalmanni]